VGDRDRKRRKRDRTDSANHNTKLGYSTTLADSNKGQLEIGSRIGMTVVTYLTLERHRAILPPNKVALGLYSNDEASSP
jgi:hypothetical protein